MKSTISLKCSLQYSNPCESTQLAGFPQQTQLIIVTSGFWYKKVEERELQATRGTRELDALPIPMRSLDALDFRSQVFVIDGHQPLPRSLVVDEGRENSPAGVLHNRVDVPEAVDAHSNDALEQLGRDFFLEKANWIDFRFDQFC